MSERLTQKDIADCVGASREMVSRIFKDLVAGGYIQVDDRVITNVLDALAAAGQGLMLASLIYFFYLVIMHGDLLRRGDQESPYEPARSYAAASPSTACPHTRPAPWTTSARG